MLAILSNGSDARINAVLANNYHGNKLLGEQREEQPLFDFVFSSSPPVSRFKPDVKIYDQVLSTVYSSPSVAEKYHKPQKFPTFASRVGVDNVLHVAGAEFDATAAKGYGFHAVWNMAEKERPFHNPFPFTDLFNPDHKLRKLSDLLKLVPEEPS
jgi:FMN phosphatase YigB (HAD superfamily)